MTNVILHHSIYQSLPNTIAMLYDTVNFQLINHISFTQAHTIKKAYSCENNYMPFTINLAFLILEFPVVLKWSLIDNLVY